MTSETIKPMAPADTSEERRDKAVAISPDELRQLLAQACAKEGQTAFARRAGCAQSQVSEALAKRRSVTDAMVVALGYFRVDRYVPTSRKGC